MPVCVTYCHRLKVQSKDARWLNSGHRAALGSTNMDDEDNKRNNDAKEMGETTEGDRDTSGTKERNGGGKE